MVLETKKPLNPEKTLGVKSGYVFIFGLLWHVITKRDRFYYKMQYSFYYKMWQKFITKFVNFITKYDV